MIVSSGVTQLLCNHYRMLFNMIRQIPHAQRTKKITHMQLSKAFLLIKQTKKTFKLFLYNDKIKYGFYKFTVYRFCL